MLAARGSDLDERWLPERLRREEALGVLDALRDLMARDVAITEQEFELLKQRLREPPSSQA